MEGKATRLNGVLQKYGPSGLQSITTTNPGANKVGTYAYTWDANKNKLTETISGSPLATKSFTTSGGTDPDGYDDEDRLVYWKHTDNSLTHDWTLTAVGDWANFKVNGTGTARTHSNAHEILTVGAQSLVHDLKGNLTINTNGDAYAWDFDNRLTGANTDGNPGDEVTFEYDALGRRVRKDNGTTNTVYILAGQQVLAEYASGAVPASPSEIYVYASYIDEPIFKTGTGGGVYYSRNQQYSITALTDSTANVVERYAYDAHGTLAIFDGAGTSIAATSYANPYTYTARRFDSETDLYYFRARYFDSALGRFTGRDALGFVDGADAYRAYFIPKDVDPSGQVLQDYRESGNVGKDVVFEKGNIIGKMNVDGSVTQNHSDEQFHEYVNGNPKHLGVNMYLLDRKRNEGCGRNNCGKRVWVSFLNFVDWRYNTEEGDTSDSWTVGGASAQWTNIDQKYDTWYLDSAPGSYFGKPTTEAPFRDYSGVAEGFICHKSYKSCYQERSYAVAIACKCPNGSFERNLLDKFQYTLTITENPLGIIVEATPDSSYTKGAPFPSESWFDLSWTDNSKISSGVVDSCGN